MYLFRRRGSTAEFNKFAHVLKVLKESADTDNGDARSHIAVFGYRTGLHSEGDALDMLHALEATIYSRFSMMSHLSTAAI